MNKLVESHRRNKRICRIVRIIIIKDDNNDL